MPLEHILVATDLSPESLFSLPWVAGLAQSTSARVTVAHVDAHAGALHGDAFAVHTERTNEYLGMFRDALDMMDVVCDVRVLSGKTNEVLERLSGLGTYDLIVTTRHGERATGLLVGSTSLHLSRTSQVPVLVVQRPTDGQPPLERTSVAIHDVVTTTDFSATSEAGVRALLPLVAALGARLHVVHVVTAAGAGLEGGGNPAQPPKVRDAIAAAETRLQVFADGLDSALVTTEVACDEVAADGVVRVAVARRAQLIAVCSHGKGRIASILLGSTTRRILTLSQVPVLVLRRDSIGGSAWAAVDADEPA